MIGRMSEWQIDVHNIYIVKKHLDARMHAFMDQCSLMDRCMEEDTVIILNETMLLIGRRIKWNLVDPQEYQPVLYCGKQRISKQKKGKASKIQHFSIIQPSSSVLV